MNVEQKALKSRKSFKFFVAQSTYFRVIIVNNRVVKGYSESESVLARAGNLLTLAGQLASEYRQLVGAYGRLAGHLPPEPDLSASVDRLPDSITALHGSGNKYNTREDVATIAEKTWLRACRILDNIRREHLGESSPLSPQQRQRLMEDVESVSLRLSGQPVPRQLALSLYP